WILVSPRCRVVRGCRDHCNHWRRRRQAFPLRGRLPVLRLRGFLLLWLGGGLKFSRRDCRKHTVSLCSTSAVSACHRAGGQVQFLVSSSVFRSAHSAQDCPKRLLLLCRADRGRPI